MADQATAEQAATIANAIVERRIEDSVNAILGGNALGFTAKVSADKELGYYQRQCFNADGTPNQAGIDALIANHGIQAWADVVDGFAQDLKKQQRGAPPHDEQPLRY